ATIDVLVDHFLRLLEEIAADPDRRVGDYPLISEVERRQILDERHRLELGDVLGSEIRKRLEAASRVYLLDRKLRLVPLAGVGEIYLEGIEPASVEFPGAAAAAAAWRPHPLSREPGSCLLATGLRGRRRADGRPELLAPAALAADIGDRPPATVGDSPAVEAAVVDKRRAGLKKRQSRFSEARKALLARRLRGRSKKTPAADGIPRRPAPDPGSRDTAPLSFAQQRLWFLEQLDPRTGLYNIPHPVRLAGSLDLAALARSLNEIVRRHEVLRTTFVSVEGEPLQVIASSLELGLPVVDLRRLTRGAREAESRRLATAELERPFDLSRGPLLRATVLRLAGEDHVILLTIHHIISDGWSMEVLTRELATLFQAISAGKPPALAELPIQYADYAIWQRQWLSGEGLEKLLGYWKEQLAGAAPRLELPADRPRPAVQTFRGRSLGIAFSPELSEALARLARQEKATMFMTLLAGLTALLARTTGQHDVVVGTPVAGRDRRELEDLIGFFINTLVLRTVMSDGNFRQHLARTRQVALDAFAHQDLPFEHLVEELQPQRDLSSTPLFQVMFILHSSSQGSGEMPGLTMVSLAEEGSAKFDLTLSLEGGAGRVHGSLGYNTDLFDRTTMERWSGQLELLLAAIVDDPERRLGELPRLAAAERHQLLAEWNDTAAAKPPGGLIHELFERQATRTPEAVALVFGDQRWSYRELDRRANQLAHHLRSLGVGAEVRVGVCAERSAELVVALLGVLKSGGAYVALDPGYPPERVAFMLEDAGVRILLTQEQIRDAIQGDFGNGNGIGNGENLAYV
ncbi:MAG: AMP-binding protein, partial [bacterium]|nr:AMP-binding protein [bacterium]